jgi:hypothetical protein
MNETPRVDDDMSPQGDDLRRSHGLGQLARREEMRSRWIGRPDGKRSHLRALLTELDTTVAALDTRTGSSTVDAVGDVVRELAAVLDLGPEPELVACGVCGRLGMQGASSCGFCWASLRPDEQRTTTTRP